MIGILSSFGSTFPFWILLDDEVDDFKVKKTLILEYAVKMLPQAAWLILQSLVRHSGHWVKPPNPAGKEMALKLGGITQNCWIMSYRTGQHKKLARCKKSILCLVQPAKATAVPRMGSGPGLQQREFCLRKGCHQQAKFILLSPTQPSIWGTGKKVLPKLTKQKGTKNC